MLEFECRGQRLGLPIGCVRRAIPSAEPVPLPGAGELVLGMLNLGGKVIAILDAGLRLGLARTPIRPDQQILVVQLPALECGLLVDRIIGVSERDLEDGGGNGLERAPFVDAMVRLDDGLCLVLDPARFLFPKEQQALACALGRGSDEVR